MDLQKKLDPDTNETIKSSNITPKILQSREAYFPFARLVVQEEWRSRA